MKILVTGGGALLGQGIIRSLKRCKFDFHLIVCDVSRYSAGLYWGDERYIIPPASSSDFAPCMESVLQKTTPDFILVGTDVELLYFSQSKEFIKRKFGSEVIVSNSEVIKVADDKYETAAFFQRMGFGFPRTVDPNDSSDLSELIAQKGFPLIVKPRVGARSVGVGKAMNHDDLKRMITEANAPIVQEYIGSDAGEYTASGLGFDGECKAAIVMRRELRDGNTYKTYFVEDELLYRRVRSWTKALNPFGPANFQFRINHNGEPIVFEINARFSGTTPLRAIAGFNEVEMCLRHLAFGEKLVQPEIRNVMIARHWSETVIEPSDLNTVQEI